MVTLCGAILAVLGSATLTTESPERHTADWRETPDAYELVAAALPTIVPPPLRAVIEANAESIRRQAVGLCLDGERKEKGEADDRHFVRLDIDSDSTDAAARESSACGFPRERSAANRLAERRKERSVGSLPWAIEQAQHDLRQAFEAGDADAVARHAAAIVHFSTDAALPFHTTKDDRGVGLGAADWCKDKSVRVGRMHCSLRDRFEAASVARLRDRLLDEVRVSPSRFQPVDHVVDAVFDVLCESHKQLSPIAAIDRETAAELRITDPAHFSDASAAFDSIFATKAAPIVEGRIEAAALLSANVIGGAWVRAGRPTVLDRPTTGKDVPDADGRSTSTIGKPSSEDKAAQPDAKPKFAGSSNSTVFHRGDCAHLRRVRPENLVPFKTAAEAKAAGRTPCKACNPDD